MSDFTVHGIPGSPYVRSALLGLEEKGAAYRIAPLRLGEHKNAEHLARHPFGRIPAVAHGDFMLYETQAILRYLDRVLPEPPLTPAEARSEARMNQVMGITDCYVMPNISAGIVFQRVIAPRVGRPSDETRVADALPMAETCIRELARLLGDGTFMAGERLTIADLMLAPHLSYFAETGEGRTLMAPHPRLLAWLDRMEARPSMRNTTWERLIGPIAA